MITGCRSPSHSLLNAVRERKSLSLIFMVAQPAAEIGRNEPHWLNIDYILRDASSTNYKHKLILLTDNEFVNKRNCLPSAQASNIMATGSFRRSCVFEDYIHRCTNTGGGEKCFHFSPNQYKQGHKVIV